MSVSHPLLKELKGFVSSLKGIEQPLDDEVPDIVLFCECLERIFCNGLLPQLNYITFPKTPEAWPWIKQLGNEKLNPPFAYTTAVSVACKCLKVSTDRGRLRLFIRAALMNKCIHIPIQMLVKYRKQKVFYSMGSILADEILTELLVSVLLFCSKLPFKLELKNSRFLDVTWNTPFSKTLSLVPCRELGLSVIFASRVPVIISMIPNSVADDEGSVSIGDILDEVNGKAVTTADQGCLGNLLRLHSGPVMVHILKAAGRGVVYPPMINILREAGLEPAKVAALSLPSDSPQHMSFEDDCCDKTVEFVGVERTGARSDVKQIHLAIRRLLARREPVREALELLSGVPPSPPPSSTRVIFTFHDLGLRVKYEDSNVGDVMYEHSFMEISCCGCTTSVPQYFAYIAGNKDYVNCRDYKCYIFHCSNKVLVEKILRSIAQGFKRTLCTV